MTHALLGALAIAMVVTLLPLPGEAQPAARPPASSLDAEVARVKKELRAIQDQPIAHEAKVQQQRALIERESASARAKIRALQADLSKESSTDTSKETKESKEAQDAARERKKAALDNLQKLLDILRSMNPQI
jgi:septal ring factor EnvC (AmiA/AmiB activator)